MHCHRLKKDTGKMELKNLYAGAKDRKAYSKQLPSGPASDKARMGSDKKTLRLPILSYLKYCSI
jgi:hypothetical protein